MQSHITLRRPTRNITFPGDGEEDILNDIIKTSQLEQVGMGGGTLEVVDGVRIRLHLMTKVSFLRRLAWLRTTLLVITFLLRDPNPLRTVILTRT